MDRRTFVKMAVAPAVSALCVESEHLRIADSMKEEPDVLYVYRGRHVVGSVQLTPLIEKHLHIDEAKVTQLEVMFSFDRDGFMNDVRAELDAVLRSG